MTTGATELAKDKAAIVREGPAQAPALGKQAVPPNESPMKITEQGAPIIQMNLREDEQ